MKKQKQKKNSWLMFSKTQVKVKEKELQEQSTILRGKTFWY